MLTDLQHSAQPSPRAGSRHRDHLRCVAWSALALALPTVAVVWVAVASGESESETAAPAAATQGVAPAVTTEAASVAPPNPPAPETARSGAAANEPGPDLTPYAVLVRLSALPDSPIDAQFRQQMLAQIATALRAGMGQMWNTTVEEADDGRFTTAAALQGLSSAELTGQFVDAAYDKVLLAGVSLTGSRWSLAVREWDAASQTAGPVYEETTNDIRLTAPLAADLLMQAFRPVARIEAVDGGLVVTTIRAGEFPPADPAAIPFEAGDLLTPFVRYYDRERNLQQIRDLPWTYLRVGNVERARMECDTVSAYKTPLSGSRRRMELMAIAVRPTYSATRLIIAPRGDASDPLPGCRVELLDRLPTVEDPVDDRQKLLTDRLGSIMVTVDPAHPLRHVLVHSGKAVLGRVPFIPGLAETVTLAIPDDSARLSVEGALSVLEGELIDAVSRRAVLMARARRAAKARKWGDVDVFLKDLESVPDYEAFRHRVASIQLPAAQAAKSLGDRVAESRINKMCTDVQQAASGHLDADKIREFRIEMAELKQAAK